MKRIFLASLLSVAYGTILPTVNWHSASIINSVYNENISIKGDCTLDGGFVAIGAYQSDITIEIDATATIRANDGSLLYITTIAPYTVTFKVKNDLFFHGKDDSTLGALSIIVNGDGIINWEIDNDKKVSFSARNDSSGGANLIIRKSLSEPIFPSIVFKCSNHKQIYFHKRSNLYFQSKGSLNNFTTESTMCADDYESSEDPYIVFEDGCEIACHFFNVL